jgi:hypothetical protein
MKQNQQELMQFEALVAAKEAVEKPVSTSSYAQLIEQRRKNLARRHG